MKPGYWIVVMALVGGIIGYAIFKVTGWLGVITGIVIGTLIYTILKGKQRGDIIPV